MQLVITAPKSTAVATTDITWVSKGGSSINSQDGRWALRKNSKGEWKVVEHGTTVNSGLTKEAAKAYAEAVVAATGTDLKAALAEGTALVHSVRSNGTLRRRHFLTGDALKAAQDVQAMREQGLGMAHIANTLHASISHVRRMLNDLAITTELSEMEADQLAAMLTGAQDAE